MHPKVSVCIPTYNCSRYLPEAIESVLRQSYRDYELIVVDDCSTDNSVEVIRTYARKDRRIRLITNAYNLGQAKNINLCLKQARGEYIKYVYSDDFLVSDHALARLVAVLDRHKDVALVSAARYLVDENAHIIGLLSEYDHELMCAGHQVIRECLLEQKNKIGEPTAVLFRKKHAQRGFHEQYNQNVDMEMWLHILEQGDFAFIHEPLCSFRRRPDQQTKLNVQQGKHFSDLFRLWRDFGRKPYLGFSRMQRIYIEYHPAFEIWKFHKKYRQISFRQAFDKIRGQYGVAKFVLRYPAFRTYKTHLSVKKRLGKIMAGWLRV